LLAVWPDRTTGAAKPTKISTYSCQMLLVKVSIATARAVVAVVSLILSISFYLVGVFLV